MISVVSRFPMTIAVGCNVHRVAREAHKLDAYLALMNTDTKWNCLLDELAPHRDGGLRRHERAWEYTQIAVDKTMDDGSAVESVAPL
jgi:hypothetical protein